MTLMQGMDDAPAADILAALDRDDVHLLVATIGPDAAVRLLRAFGGSQFYVPTLDRALRALRNKRILKDYTGTNEADLARKYNVAQQTVYKIVRDAKARGEL
jgi:Mor family transcriptional regulator